MATLQSNLILSLVDRITGPMKALNAAIARNDAALAGMRGQMMDALGAGYALYKGLSAPVSAAIEFESAMADIKKVVDFETPAAFAQMSQDIRRMSLSIPMAADGIAQIVAAAGQSGIAQNELTKFAEIAAKVGVAWDISAGSAGEALAKLKTALGRSVDDTASLADAINHLGNNSAASAPQILDVVRRVAPMASQFGMSAEQVAAIGAAMTGAGFESEVAATSLLNVGRALTKGESATARQMGIFKRLGLSAKGVAKSMQKDAVGTLQDVLKRINKLPAETRAAAVSDLFGDEARALGPLISNADLLADSLEMVADKSRYAGSAANEYASASDRSANRLQLFRNRVNDLGISIGNALLPALNTILEKIGPVVTSISNLAEEYPQLTTAIVGATTAVVGFRIALTALRFAGLFALGGILRAGLALAPVGGVLTAVGAALATISAPVWLGIAAGAAAVGFAGAVIWKNWDAISSIFSGIARRLGEELRPALDAIWPVLDWLGPIGETIASGFGTAVTAVGNFFSGIGSWFSREILTEEQKAGFENAGYQAADRLINAVKAKIAELVEWFRSLPSKILDAIGTIDIGSRIRANLPSLPSWLGGGEQPTEAPKVDGARAAGGPVGRGGTYLVGERGPELFSPGRSGMISPTEAYTAARAGSAAGSGGYSSGYGPVTLNVSPTINITAANAPNDDRAFARDLTERLGQYLAGQFDGHFGFDRHG